MTFSREITRRKFIFTAVAGGGGMMLGFHLPLAQALTGATDQQGLIADKPWTAPTDGAGSEVNAWLLISPDDTVTIRVAQSEMGEGVFTSMPMIVAEELQCDWSKVKAEYASANRSLREGGSTSAWLPTAAAPFDVPVSTYNKQVRVPVNVLSRQRPTSGTCRPRPARPKTAW